MTKMLNPTVCAAMLALAGASSEASAASPAESQAADKDPIADYLTDLSAGPIAASEFLGLSGSAVITLQAPKDFVAAVNALSAGATSPGFGLAFTPGRTGFAPVSISSYSSNPGARLWAGTTFSYAQNINTLDSVDYRQQAYALHVSYYLDPQDDPSIVARQAFVRCANAMEVGAQAAAEINRNFLALVQSGVPSELANEQARVKFAKSAKFSKEAAAAVKLCMDNSEEVQPKDKWNASQVGLTVGQAWIRNPASNSPRLSLGKSIAVAVAVGPNADSLVNLTVRRTNKAVILDTLSASDPDYKSSTLLGARWTYRATQSKDLYAIAEISNAKGASSGTSNNVFKTALGVDKRLSEGIWIQLRVGRNRTADDKSDQTSALMSFKFSPASTLPQ